MVLDQNRLDEMDWKAGGINEAGWMVTGWKETEEKET